jgi:clan AA aspartic protease (TIGR02281 family)
VAIALGVLGGCDSVPPPPPIPSKPIVLASKAAGAEATQPYARRGVPPATSPGSEIPLHRSGGTFTAPASINGAITLEFTIDSGATDVSIPADVVMTLMRTGTINRSDFLGRRTYVQADGSTLPSPIFRIRSIRVGNREATNVTASVAPIQGTLLLGQSFLRQFSSWSIDNRRGVLVLN